jgi:hypothetical protein
MAHKQYKKAKKKHKREKNAVLAQNSMHETVE